MTQPTMMLINSIWNEKPTFNMIPVSLDSPYAEGIFDPESKQMALISKIPKQSFHMMPKLNDYGDPELTKTTPRPNGKRYKEERKSLDTLHEHYIVREDDIRNFIKLVAVNADTFNLDMFFVQMAKISNIETSDKSIVTPPKIEIVSK